MKKVCLIFCLLFTLCFVGCSDVEAESTYVLPGGIASDGVTHSNETLAIYGGDGEQIGELEQYDIIAQTQGSIIYSKVPKGSEKKLKKLDLYRYMVDTGENIKLGTVKRWVTQVADPVEADGHLYLLAETGNLFHKYGYFGLFDIDLGKNTLTKLQSGKGARYHSMAVAGDQILLAKEDRIEAYDQNTEEMKTMLKADLDEESYRGEHLRKIFSDEEGIVVLKFVDTEGLLMERYDSGLHLTETKNLSILLPDAVDETASTRRFAYVKPYLFYESFAQACFWGSWRERPQPIL